MSPPRLAYKEIMASNLALFSLSLGWLAVGESSWHAVKQLYGEAHVVRN